MPRKPKEPLKLCEGLQLIPGIGSRRWEYACDAEKILWTETAEGICRLCKNPIGASCYIRVRGNDVVHESCDIDALDAEMKLADNPFWIERIAAHKRMTIEGVRHMPRYERLLVIHALEGRQ